MTPPYYPLNDFGPIMKGVVIGGMGIVHVFVAQFAIGGGMLLTYFEWLAQRGRSAHARPFLDSYFRALVLVSFVIGALTGVGMWLMSIQISPRTIGMMVDEFHWLWATEWTFFCLEIVSGYLFYRYSAVLSDRARLTLLVLYSVAAWMSLFWINGILSWQLTPGVWPQTGDVWAGFFNPSFFPSLLYRTVVALTIAALTACIVINVTPGLERYGRSELIHRTSVLLAPMVLMPFLGLWYLAVMPEDSRSWILGGSAAMTLFFCVAVGASVLIGMYALLGLWRRRLYINGATAALLVALAFAATAGGEFVREGVRKPFTIRETLYSNSITPEEVPELRRIGSVTEDPFPLPHPERYPTEQLRLGARVLAFQCGVCHTTQGMNGLTHLTGTWTIEQMRLNIAKLQYTKPFMPPFAGTATELESLVQLLRWINAGRPDEWPVARDEQALERIRVWLKEAGTAPAPLHQSPQER